MAPNLDLKHALSLSNNNNTSASLSHLTSRPFFFLSFFPSFHLFSLNSMQHHHQQHPQEPPEHHRLLDIHSTHDHADSSAFVGQSDLSPSSLGHPPISTRKRAQDRTTQPSLWNTKEFYFYYLVFAFCVPYMFKTAHDASSGKCSCVLCSDFFFFYARRNHLKPLFTF